MSDKVQLIKQEIENQIDFAEEATRFSEPYRKELITAYQTIKAFIDSLPEEPASGNLEEEIKNYIQKEYPDGMGFPNVPKIARHFAELQKQKDMQDFLEKAEKWIEKHIEMFSWVHCDSDGNEEWRNDFKNYMQNESEN